MGAGSYLKSTIAPRRGFFGLLLSEVIGLREELQGRPQMRLSELDKVPDEVVRQMTPVFNKQLPYHIEDDRLLLKQKKTGVFQEVDRFNAQEMVILQHFDKQQTLEEIGRRVADEFGQDQEAAYQQVKTLFLRLAKHFLCFPAQPHDE